MYAIGSPFPALPLDDTDGHAFSTGTGAGSTLLYVMRSTGCAICNAHVRDLIARADELGSAGVRVAVAVPESRGKAADWKAARRVPFTVVVGRDGTPHASLGLAKKMFGAMNQSGSVLVDSSGTVRHVQFATMPTGAYDKNGIAAAIQALEPAPVA